MPGPTDSLVSGFENLRRISHFITDKSGIISEINTQLTKFFGLDPKPLQRSIQPHFDQLVDHAYFLIEYPYVDKVYRNSYYSYFSSKLNSYERDCIRISIFSSSISVEEFRTQSTDIQGKYLGFLILRPTEPNLVGRSIISPKALKANNFSICSAKFNTTAYENKFHINGFPHASQDMESLTCAETSLWALMEYFSAKYSQYKSILPSDITQLLDSFTSERLIPSSGLDIQKLSFVLKKMGFGSIIYSRSAYAAQFENLLSCYIESGIPIILALVKRSKKIGHAMICIGHENSVDTSSLFFTPITLGNANLRAKATSKNITFYDYDNLRRRFVFIDDNQPAYQLQYLNTPTAHYINHGWEDWAIDYFLVPLYPKIYLDAMNAKEYTYSFLIRDNSPLDPNKEYLLRTFLTSSRSYKHYIANNREIDPFIKDLLLETLMPKFIWVTEISDQILSTVQKANGIMILDATEKNTYDSEPFIYCGYSEKQIIYNEIDRSLDKLALTLHPFSIYSENLQNFQI